MSVRTFLDTNVLVYLFDSKEPVKQSAIVEAFLLVLARPFCTPSNEKAVLKTFGQ